MSTTNLVGGQTLTGVSGLNVVCVSNVNITKDLFLDGPANQSAESIFVVTEVLYNVIGTGTDVSFSGGGGGTNPDGVIRCCKASIDGSLIATDRKIALSPGLINGQVCGNRDQACVSGSAVHCPTQQPPMVIQDRLLVELAQVGHQASISRARRTARGTASERGFTLIELLVAAGVGARACPKAPREKHTAHDSEVHDDAVVVSNGLHAGTCPKGHRTEVR